MLIHLFIQYSLRTCVGQAPLSMGNMNTHLLRKTDTGTTAQVLRGRIHHSKWKEALPGMGNDKSGSRHNKLIQEWLGMCHKNQVLGDMFGKTVGKNGTHNLLLGRVGASLLYVLCWTDF